MLVIYSHNDLSSNVIERYNIPAQPHSNANTLLSTPRVSLDLPIYKRNVYPYPAIEAPRPDKDMLYSSMPSFVYKDIFFCFRQSEDGADEAVEA